MGCFSKCRENVGIAVIGSFPYSKNNSFFSSFRKPVFPSLFCSCNMEDQLFFHCFGGLRGCHLDAGFLFLQFSPPCCSLPRLQSDILHGCVCFFADLTGQFSLERYLKQGRDKQDTKLGTPKKGKQIMLFEILVRRRRSIMMVCLKMIWYGDIEQHEEELMVQFSFSIYYFIFYFVMAYTCTTAINSSYCIFLIF